MNPTNFSQRPPPILTSEPGSFARRTFEVRIPRILEDTIAANRFPPEIVAALQALRHKVLAGVIQPLGEETPDKDFWLAHSRAYIGRTWLDVPWYWAESYLYRLVLEATRYFQPGEWYLRDPYANQKAKELEPQAGPRALHAILERLPQSPDDRFRMVLQASLWGNRTDLSYNVARHAPGALSLESEAENLLVDDTERVWRHLRARSGGQVSIICDNAGTELLFDFALADLLLQRGLASQVTLHLKPQPFFVSDAMIPDAEATLAALVDSPSAHLNQLGRRLQQEHAVGHFAWLDHPFWAGCLFFFELPDELHTALASASLVISKGDANYRRLLGDGHWLPITPFAGAAGYFPAPLVALRTCKSELIVGLPPGAAERYQTEDAEWLTNGRRGLVQFKPEDDQAPQAPESAT